MYIYLYIFISTIVVDIFSYILHAASLNRLIILMIRKYLLLRKESTIN